MPVEQIVGGITVMVDTPEEVEANKKEAAKVRMEIARAAKRPRSRQVAPPKRKPSITLKEMSIDEAKAEAPAAPIKLKDAEITWFTEVDFNDKHKVASDYPAWYFDGQPLNDLREEVRSLEEDIELGVYTGQKLVGARRNLNLKKDRLEKIINGRPKLDGQLKDKVVRSWKELGSRLTDSMFSYDSHWKQIADPHMVAERMVKPCIEIKDEIVHSYAKQRGMRIENGKISQNDASIIFKSVAKLIGEQSSTDYLRPTRSHGITD